LTVYYVELTGNDANTGLAPGAATAWRTIAFSITTMGSGDLLYVKSGTYSNEYVVQTNTDTLVQAYATVPGDTGRATIENNGFLDPAVLEISGAALQCTWSQIDFHFFGALPGVTVATVDIQTGSWSNFLSCTFECDSTVPLCVKEAAGSGGINFLRCGFTGDPSTSVFLQLNSGTGRGTSVKQCNFVHNAFGIGPSGIEIASSITRSLSIEECIFFATNNSIDSTLASAFVVSRCAFFACTVGVVLQANSNLCIVNGCAFSVTAGVSLSGIRYDNAANEVVSEENFDQNHFYVGTPFSYPGAGSLLDRGTGVVFSGGSNDTSGDPLYTSPATGDLQYTSASPLYDGNEFLFAPSSFMPGSTSSFEDRGAIQRKPPGGGAAGLLVNAPLTGGMR